MTGRSGHDLGREHLARLEDYIASGDALPTRAGKVNVTAIARACGFDRQVLYKNPPARALLDRTAAAQGCKGIEAERDGAAATDGADEALVPVSRLREAERRAGALEKRVSELAARNAALVAQLRRMDVVAENLIARGRRAAPGSGMPSFPGSDERA